MRSLFVRFLFGCWIIGVVGGILFLTHYSNKPGKAAEAPESWPSNTSIGLTTDRSSLLVLVHPQCSCSRATLRQLERIVAHAGDRLSTRVVFFEPEGVPEDWLEGDLWQMANALPGVEVTRDPYGEIISTFGAFTSGQALLYDSSGVLRFKGGITAARGHEGDNMGQEAILSIIEDDAATSESYVFGCSILGE